MATSKAVDVNQYLATLPAERRKAVETLRALTREIAPDAVEKITYGMPTYQLGAGGWSFASQKSYLSLYVCDSEVVSSW